MDKLCPACAYMHTIHKYTQTEEGQSLSVTSINALPLVSSDCIPKQYKSVNYISLYISVTNEIISQTAEIHEEKCCILQLILSGI